MTTVRWSDKRDTKIICTIGPASSNEAILEKMASRGMDVVRLNFSHGGHDDHKRIIDLVRLVNKKYDYNIKILQDLEGHRIRVGALSKSVMLEKNQIFYMIKEEQLTEKHADTIPLDIVEDLDIITEGLNIYIDDGKLRLRVVAYNKTTKRLKVKVVQGGLLRSRKGINIPKLKLQSNILTPKDRDDMEFGIANGVDYIAQSFVRNKKDITRVTDKVKKRLPNTQVIAKIETEEGVKNILSIIDSSDGVMVARGDLGVTLPLYKIPIIQKYIIRRCNRKKKFVITATQMLESMIENGRPTRAEVSDVANAILDGTDFVMLSGETAVGKFPSRSVKVMSQIIDYTEHYDSYKL